MKEKLISDSISFFSWFAIGAPLKQVKSLLRFIKLVNNEVSITLNLKLLFTPLFGDSTYVGRGIGFVFRTFTIIFGTIFEIILIILIPVLPLVWLGLPIYLLFNYGIYAFLYLMFVFFAHIFYRYPKPQQRITERTTVSNLTKSFRPVVTDYFREFLISKKIPQALLSNSSTTYLLKKLELHDNDFLPRIQNITLDKANVESNILSLCKELDAKYVEPEILFLALVASIPKIDIMLSEYSLKIVDFNDTVKWIITERYKKDAVHFWQDDYVVSSGSGAGKGLTGHVTPYLDSISRDFTELAAYGEFKPVTVHQDKTAELIKILASSTTNVLIVGPAGCGKTSVVKGIAQKIAQGKANEDSIKFKRIVAIETSALISGTKTAGEISEKIKKMMVLVNYQQHYYLQFPYFYQQ